MAKRGPKPGSKTQTALYKKLRAKLTEKGHDQIDLAKLLDRCLTYVSLRFCGHMAWDMDDVYRMCLIYEIPHDQIHLYFPKDGKAA